MGPERFLLVCATLAALCLAILAQSGLKQGRVPKTRFTCTGRAAGYYADVETGCQVYHMCDGLGRQFSYTCPNTTLFQQRMLICDHWYMVNCSMSERDYSANLLIGQRDKPFVSDEEMRLRTPRPDILSVPANSNYFTGLKEAESKYESHPGNSIVGIGDSLSSANNNGLDRDKPSYRPPTSWSTHRPRTPPKQDLNEEDIITGAASQRPSPTVQSTPPDRDFTHNTGSQNTGFPNVTPTPPPQHLVPPFAPTTEASEEMDIDVRMKDDDDRVVKFIRRFDPNSPDSIKTAMTRSEILNVNAQLPAGQSSAEDDRTPRRNKNVGNDFNRVENDKKGFVEASRFDTINTKPEPTEATLSSDSKFSHIPTPAADLVPPKTDSETSSVGTTTTVGPPIYYEWKWAAPAFDLEPPKESNETNVVQGKRNISGDGRSPFRSVTRPPPPDLEPVAPTKNSEYNISSYFVPDYVFPLDKEHPGYEDEHAHTSFQVEVARPGRTSYGENPACPHCHPAYLEPGSCEPCIVKR
ncbi:uncharacterized protein LOC126371259 [Pectinophora gossypiella]|uniref:uncharacterized protein LOC126371259 n=1 Tax=Pectinophora gossypiella TaxID=13191 RepID=UPI00214F13CA|nr:uncharacterized protein LOC126371259 [Pectinophora gossypiella]XP_049872495.1 uncharacterized protein LOC126371259 [Pectinophora gossypiella]XP_049872496.1 uncharacterized protein LOC126371259 [Pectinophora gossypiella]